MYRLIAMVALGSDTQLRGVQLRHYDSTLAERHCVAGADQRRSDEQRAQGLLLYRAD